MNFITQLTANNSAVLSSSSVFTANFDTYLITLENVLPSSVGQNLLFQVYSASGAGAFPITSYISAWNLNNAGTNTGGVNTTGFPIGSTLQSSVGPGISGYVYMMDPVVNLTQSKMIWAQTGGNSVTPSAQMMVTSGYWGGGNGAITGFRLIFGTSGSVVNIASGNARIYGINTP